MVLNAPQRSGMIEFRSKLLINTQPLLAANNLPRLVYLYQQKGATNPIGWSK